MVGFYTKKVPLGCMDARCIDTQGLGGIVCASVRIVNSSSIILYLSLSQRPHSSSALLSPLTKIAIDVPSLVRHVFPPHAA